MANRVVFRVSIFAALLSLAAGQFAGAQIKQVDVDGPIAILTPAQPSAAETHAVAELKSHLERATKREVVIATGAEARPDAFTFHVGSSAAAAAQGLQVSQLEDEQWVVQSIDNGVVLIGGGTRGTLYAVYHYLEDVAGIHWWNPTALSVPSLKTLPVPTKKLTGKPAFAYRDLYTYLDGRVRRFAPKEEWLKHRNERMEVVVRNRSNRGGDDIPLAMGGSESWGKPYHIHTMEYYFPPKEYFETHPEYFALVGGKRQRDQSQLCITSPDVRRLTIEKLRGYIESSRNEPRYPGLAEPDAFWLAPNDWLGWCECEACDGLMEREGGRRSGYLLDYVNHAARAIKDEYPDVLIYTLAYVETLEPPTRTRPEENVVIYLCDTYRDSSVAYGTRIEDPVNAKWREAIDGWSKITKRLRIWDYCDTFQLGAGLPLPMGRSWQDNLRYYRKRGIEGTFSQFAYDPYPFGGMAGWGKNPLGGDLTGFQPWLRMKLTENPDLDYLALTETFCDGYFGSASPMIQKCYRLVEESLDRNGHKRLAMVAAPEHYWYIDRKLLSETAAAFDEAENVSAGDVEQLHRVRLARALFDRALLTRWRLLKDEPSLPVPDLNATADRYRETLFAEMDRWFPLDAVPAWRNAQDHQRLRDQVEKDIATYIEAATDK